MKRLVPLLFLMLSLNAPSSHALEPWIPTDSEMASLPAFCKARFNEGSPEYKLWQSSLGRDYGHTHHYCAGINFLSRSYRARSKQGKSFNLNNARTNFDYMVKHAAPTYSLMPEVYSSLGTVYSLMGQPAQAINHFIKAIELNPRQPKAYNALADFYVRLKQPAKALETVSDGLRHNPGTNSLQRRYTELGGRMPYPEPIEPVAVPTPQVTPQEDASAPAVDQAGPATAPEPAPVVPQIGSPKNPYCRFCPD